MGTGGLWGFRYKGYYYAWYRRSESYYEGLGRGIVALIPQDTAAYVAWKAQVVIERGIHETHMQLEAGIQFNPEERDGTFTEFEFHQHPNPYPPANSLWMSCIYVVDLDRDVFTVDNTHHFKIPGLPRGGTVDGVQQWEWIERWNWDEGHQRRLINEDFPEEYSADLSAPVPPVQLSSIMLYDSFNPTTSFDPFPTSIHLSSLPAKITNLIFLRYLKTYRRLLTAPKEWTADSLPFQQLAFGLICILRGCGEGFTISPIVPEEVKPTFPGFKEHPPYPQWNFPGRKNGYWLHDPLAASSSQAQREPGSIWVQLATHLHDQNHLRSVIGDVIAKAQSEQNPPFSTSSPASSSSFPHIPVFRAIIFSITHAVLINIDTPNQRITCSPVLTVFDCVALLEEDKSWRSPAFDPILETYAFSTGFCAVLNALSGEGNTAKVDSSIIIGPYLLTRHKENKVFWARRTDDSGNSGEESSRNNLVDGRDDGTPTGDESGDDPRDIHETKLDLFAKTSIYVLSDETRPKVCVRTSKDMGGQYLYPLEVMDHTLFEAWARRRYAE